MSEKRALGRGLSSLIQPTITSSNHSENRSMIPLGLLHEGIFQPRTYFDEDEIIALGASIQEKGVLQPIVVRPSTRIDGHYEIIAGERRWRASKLVQLSDIPAVITHLNDREALEVALLENIQRKDLSPLEEAEGYKRLMDEFSYTQEALSKSLGKSRSHVANLLRLIQLPDEIKAMVHDGRLSAGHARAVLTANDPIDLAHLVVQEDLSVRQAEELAKISPEQRRKRTTSQGKSKIYQDPESLQVESQLSNLLGLRTTLTLKSSGKGHLDIHFDSMEDLDHLMALLSRTKEK